MSYVSKTLLKEESVNYEAHLHWWIFIPPTGIMAAGMLLLGVTSNVVVVIGWILVVLSLIGIISRIIMTRTSEFVVTNKRVILKKGLIIREVSDLQLSKAEAIVFKESLCGRIFGFGTIIVTTGGMRHLYPYVASPGSFRKAINNAIDMAQGKE